MFFYHKFVSCIILLYIRIINNILQIRIIQGNFDIVVIAKRYLLISLMMNINLLFIWFLVLYIYIYIYIYIHSYMYIYISNIF